MSKVKRNLKLKRTLQLIQKNNFKVFKHQKDIFILELILFQSKIQTFQLQLMIKRLEVLILQSYQSPRIAAKTLPTSLILYTKKSMVKCMEIYLCNSTQFSTLPLVHISQATIHHLSKITVFIVTKKPKDKSIKSQSKQPKTPINKFPNPSTIILASTIF